MADNNQYSIETLKEYLELCQQIADDCVFEAFAYLAEECVNRVRDRSADDSWIDRTGNLRSSIGYIITANGKPMVKGGFKPTSAPDGNGAKGQSKGPSYADSIASQLAYAPIALIVVAGMEYAVYVEARNNKDVLAATELWARAEWRNREPKLKAKIEKKWSDLANKMGIA